MRYWGNVGGFELQCEVGSAACLQSVGKAHNLVVLYTSLCTLLLRSMPRRCVAAHIAPSPGHRARCDE